MDGTKRAHSVSFTEEEKAILALPYEEFKKIHEEKAAAFEKAKKRSRNVMALSTVCWVALSAWAVYLLNFVWHEKFDMSYLAICGIGLACFIFAIPADLKRGSAQGAYNHWWFAASTAFAKERTLAIYRQINEIDKEIAKQEDCLANLKKIEEYMSAFNPRFGKA
ncbi:MAG: hypothetical protein WC459_04895 [Patescibacteria group bacterium]